MDCINILATNYGGIPYITSTNKIYNSYNLIFKDIDKAFGITYTNDVFKRKQLFAN